jgi:hypothetical protein
MMTHTTVEGLQLFLGQPVAIPFQEYPRITVNESLQVLNNVFGLKAVSVITRAQESC